MIFLWGPSYDTVDAGGWLSSINTALVDNVNTVNFPNYADQEAISWNVYMEAGTYTCKIMVYISSNQGICKVKIDGVTVATFDKYAADPVANVINTTTGIVVATTGVKTVQYIIDGKNESSTGYRASLNSIAFYRVA